MAYTYVVNCIISIIIAKWPSEIFRCRPVRAVSRWSCDIGSKCPVKCQFMTFWCLSQYRRGAYSHAVFSLGVELIVWYPEGVTGWFTPELDQIVCLFILTVTSSKNFLYLSNVVSHAVIVKHGKVWVSFRFQSIRSA